MTILDALVLLCHQIKPENLDVRMKGLPTSKSGLESGQLWKDGEYAKIKG